MVKRRRSAAFTLKKNLASQTANRKRRNTLQLGKTFFAQGMYNFDTEFKYISLLLQQSAVN